MNHIADIEQSLRNAWSAGGKVYINALVCDEYNNVYPWGYETQVMGSPFRTITLSIGLSACKQFTLNPETGMFDYDICMHGKPFYGSLHPDSIVGVFNLDNEMFFGVWEPRPVSQTPVEIPTKSGLRVASVNDNIAPQKPKAKLHLVH